MKHRVKETCCDFLIFNFFLTNQPFKFFLKKSVLQVIKEIGMVLTRNVQFVFLAMANLTN